MSGEPRDREIMPVELVQHRATLGDKGAFKVSRDGVEAYAVWIPKSQVVAIEFVETTLTGIRNRFFIERRLAAEKGLLAPARDAGHGDLFAKENGDD